jgi:hypothetical protein
MFTMQSRNNGETQKSVAFCCEEPNVYLSKLGDLFKDKEKVKGSMTEKCTMNQDDSVRMYSLRAMGTG